MAIAFRSAGTVGLTANSVANPSTLAPGAPAGKVAGDTLVCLTFSRSNTATVTTPTGWNLVTGFPKRSAGTSGGSWYAFTRTADGTATDTPSVVWTGLATGTTAGDSSSAIVLAYTGATEVLDSAVQSSALASQTTTTVIPAATTSTAGSVVIGAVAKILDSTATSTVATFTERADWSTTTGVGHIGEVSDIILASAGSSGTATVTWSVTTSANALAISFALKAAVATTTGVAQLSLAPATTPSVRTNHTIKLLGRVTAGSFVSGAAFNVALYQGTTNISGNLTNAGGVDIVLTNYSFPISSVAAASITDYSNLEIRLWGTTTPGTAPQTFIVDQIYLELPTGATAFVGPPHPSIILQAIARSSSW